MFQVYDSKAVSDEMVRDLIGLNKVALRCAYGLNKLRDTQYFASFEDAGLAIQERVLDLDVMEVWVGVTEDDEESLAVLIFKMSRDRKFVSHQIHNSGERTIDNIVLRVLS